MSQESDKFHVAGREGRDALAPDRATTQRNRRSADSDDGEGKTHQGQHPENK